MKRRDFIKNMAITGAAASVAGTLGGVLPQAANPKSAQAAQDGKLVFISDVHMNVDGSFSWFKDHAQDLIDFLDNLGGRSDVAELIILGDLVDDWVSPTQMDPQTFSQVLGDNSKVVGAFQSLLTTTDIKVTYVTGNHDLLSFQPDNRKILEDNFPGMQIISDSPGYGAYTKDNVLWAEHGHRYTLFNAPDTWSRSSGHLPLGYFISRLAASKSVTDGSVYTTPELLDQYVSNPGENGVAGGEIIDDALIVAIFNAIALWSGHAPWSKFTEQGLDGMTSDPSVEGVALTYDRIFSQWPSRQNIVDHYQAIWGDVGRLEGAAGLLFDMPSRIKDKYPFTPRIVLFGHTHKAAFNFHYGDVDAIYANTGTWIDKKPETWVEVGISDAGGGLKNYEVALWFNGESSPRHSGSITAQAAGAKAR